MLPMTRVSKAVITLLTALSCAGMRWWCGSSNPR